MVLGFFRALCFLFLLLGCSNPYERDNPRDSVHVYTVTFSAGEAAGGVPPADVSGYYGEVIQLPNQGGLARYGYVFAGWNATSPYTVIGNATLYAVWVPVYTVTFDGNGATGGLPPAAVSADSGTVTVLPANGTLERAGYSFGGWSAASPYAVTGNATLYAKWVPIYAVTFDGNGATGGLPPAAVSADSGTVIELPDGGSLERAGYSFAGWDVVSPYTVTGNATLYAKWVPVYTVAFDGNGATSGLPPAAVSADSGTVILLPVGGTLEIAGYFFAGWNTDSSGTGAGYAVGSNYAVDGNAMLYAVWSLTPTLACAMTATTGTVGTAISPMPTVTCNGTAVTAGLAWTPANLIPTSTGSLAVSVSASSGVCSGITAVCGTVYIPPVVSNCDGLVGATVKIGTQTWMKSNLNCNVAGSKCYGNELSNCDKYGKLYNWATAMGLSSSCNENTCSGQIQSPHKGICPSGWHIPSDADWNVLMDYVGGSSTIGKYLKATSGWNSYNGASGNGTDEFGFSALPGGYGYPDGSFFYSAGNCGFWWGAIELSSDYAGGIFMSSDNEGACWPTPNNKPSLLSVRCLQDGGEPVPSSSSVAPSSSSAPVFACTMTATTGTVGVQISPTPTVSCNGTAVSSGLAWTPASLIPTTSGNVAVSVSASSGVCSGMTAVCGSVNVAPNYGPALHYEGQTYKTVVIGTQTWMAENLNYDVPGSRCYDNSESNCEKYGRLYNWTTAMDLPSSCNRDSCSDQIQSPHKGICPSDWHLPSYEEWNTLTNFVESNSGCSGCNASKLKATSGWHNCGPSDSGNSYLCEDTYGFSALPGGYYSNLSGNIVNAGAGSIGRWWDATEYDSGSAYQRSMLSDYKGMGGGANGKSTLYNSVRCVQNFGYQIKKGES